MRTYSRKLSIAITAVGSTLCISFLSVLPSNGLDKESVLPTTKTVAFNEPEQAESGRPVRLTIPSIKVDSAIEYVGLTRRGEMDVPKRHGNVAWFSPGTRPGENGSAVIAGHYSWKGNGDGGVFRNLSKLRKGDLLYILDDKGTTVSFVVRESRLYDWDADASEVFTSANGARLNLVTCAGTWDNSKQSSTKRRVIFAEIVHQRSVATAT